MYDLKIFVMFGVILSGRTSDRKVRTELKMHYFLSTALQLTYETTAAVERCECLRELAREEETHPYLLLIVLRELSYKSQDCA